MPTMLDDLDQAEHKISSQNGEDGVIAAIFKAIGVSGRTFVEFGVEDATECNAANLLKQGWTGLMMDGNGISRNPLATVHREFITAENVNELFAKYQVPRAFDFLCIDIDSNDYWVWKALTYRPRVVAIEYNASVPPELRRVVAYDPNFQWKNTDYFGASLGALAELGARKGYELVYCERAGVNAFFCARSELPANYAARSPAQLYRPPNYFYQGLRHLPDPDNIMIDPEARGLFESAVCAQQTGNAAEAEKLYRELLDGEPAHADALHQLGLLKLQAGDHSKAIESIRRAIELNPAVAAYFTHLGQAYKNAGYASQAQECYRQALQLNPDGMATLKYLALSLREAGQPAEAASCYRQLLARYPGEVDAHNNLGNVLHRLGQPDEAVRCFKQALQLLPEHASAHNNLGIAMALQERTGEAIACFREALRHKPEFIDALSNLGFILKREGELTEAAECCRKVLRLNPRHTGARNILKELGCLPGD